jgi:hypothetical protein
VGGKKRWPGCRLLFARAINLTIIAIFHYSSMNFTFPNYTLSIWHIRRGQHSVRTLFRNEIERGQGKNVRSHHHRYFHYQRYLRAFTRKEKQTLSRQLFDHSTFMAPINMFMTAFSSLPARQLSLRQSASLN